MVSMIVAFLKVGAASFGGGWTVVGIIKQAVVEPGWLSPDAFSDAMAIAQVTPGPIALNVATLVGYRLYGLVGAAAATLAVVTVPLALAATLMTLYHRHASKGDKLMEALKTGTLGLLVMTLWALAPATLSSWQTALASVVAFAVASFTKINPLWVILGAGLTGGLARIFFV